MADSRARWPQGPWVSLAYTWRFGGVRPQFKSGRAHHLPGPCYGRAPEPLTSANQPMAAL